ncbi:hypothetical protein EDD17DRAFT_1514725 [Pisolithus thermaeus]|nr:hypothetical protein EDD17DRAFT_1514725 [Pisolithus thermaeus]
MLLTIIGHMSGNLNGIPTWAGIQLSVYFQPWRPPESSSSFVSRGNTFTWVTKGIRGCFHGSIHNAAQAVHWPRQANAVVICHIHCRFSNPSNAVLSTMLWPPTSTSIVCLDADNDLITPFMLNSSSGWLDGGIISHFQWKFSMGGWRFSMGGWRFSKGDWGFSKGSWRFSMSCWGELEIPHALLGILQGELEILPVLLGILQGGLEIPQAGLEIPQGGWRFPSQGWRFSMSSGRFPRQVLSLHPLWNMMPSDPEAQNTDYNTTHFNLSHVIVHRS